MFSMKNFLICTVILLSSSLYSQPTITNFYPKQAKGGDKVTLIGTNFNSTTSNNVVWLGGAKCSIQSATSTKLIITLPDAVTHNYFHYTNKSTGLSCYSINKLIPYFSNTGGYNYGSSTFNTAITYTTGAMTQNTASYGNKFGTIDQDNDGKMDVLIFNGQSLDLYDNVHTSGNWASASFSKTALNSISLVNQGFTMEFGNTVIGDLDGDGDLDAIGGCPGYVSKRVMKNTTTSSLAFTLQTNTNTSYDNSASLSDLNNDGLIDYLSHYMVSSSGIAWCENTYSGSNANIGFTQWYTSLTNSPSVMTNAPCDFNKDGKVDVISSISTTGIMISKNNTTANAGASSFSWSNSSSISTSVQPRTIVIADFNNDSLEDVFTCGWSSTLNFFKNTSTSSNISFASTVTNSFGSGSCLGAAAADMNNDGFIDIIVSKNAGLFLIPNTSTATTFSFGTAVAIGSAGANLEYIDIVDLDGDGLLDIMGHNGDQSLKVFINQLNNTPTISYSASINSFSTCSGNSSSTQSFSVSGIKLTANIVVTAPTNFEVSSSSTTGFGSSVTLSPTSGTLGTTTLYIRVKSNSSTGSISGNISLTSTGANTETIALSGTVITSPTISGTLNLDKNATAQLSGSGTANNSSPWFSSNSSIATVSSSGLVSGVDVGSTTITYTDNNGCTATSTVTISPIEFYIKSNATSALSTLSSWTSNSNGTGSSPSNFNSNKTFNLSNSSGSTSFSTGNNNWTITSATLVIPSGATLIIGTGRTLTLSSSTLSNSGTINASDASMEISGTGNNTINGTLNIGTLTTNTSSNITIGSSAALNVFTALNLTSVGTFTTNNNVTLKSNSTGTARMGSVSGTISGNMNCEIYVAGGYRKFRFLAHPFSSNQNLSLLTDDIDITGNGGSSNGFTTTSTNNPSAYWYSPANGDGANYDAGWTPFTSAAGGSGNNWATGQGIIVMLRGDKGEGLDGSTYTPSDVIIDMSGPVNKGDVTVNLEYSGSGNSKGLNLLGNPYPCPIDDSGLVHGSSHASKINKTIYTRNSRQGSYRTDAISSGTAYSVPAYASFFLKTNATTASVTFTESMKQNSSSISTFLGGGDESTPNLLRISALIKNEVYDKLDFFYGEQYGDTFDHIYDAFKLTNDYFNLYSLTSDESKVAIDYRKLDTNQLISIGLEISKNKTDSIELFFDANNTGTSLYLFDLLTRVKTEIKTGNKYSLFASEIDKETIGNNRLLIGSFSAIETLSANLKNNLVVTLYPNPVNDILFVHSLNFKGVSTIKIRDLTGKIVNEKIVDFSQEVTQKIETDNLLPGTYHIEITTENGLIYQNKIIK